jgi:hypothetical protein
LELFTEFTYVGRIERPKSLESLELLVDPVPDATVE